LVTVSQELPYISQGSVATRVFVMGSLVLAWLQFTVESAGERILIISQHLVNTIQYNNTESMLPPTVDR